MENVKKERQRVLNQMMSEVWERACDTFLEQAYRTGLGSDTRAIWKVQKAYDKAKYFGNPYKRGEE